ncbi:hypothetical protein K438DRAFT_1828143 [Mycena galopus ATCC 62051]|nr:hypothetical protein K438DRAFT_1828143 [Mycena galopus ATCC 62051]
MSLRPLTLSDHTPVLPSIATTAPTDGSPTPSLLNVAASPVAAHIRMQPHYLELNKATA